MEDRPMAGTRGAPGPSGGGAPGSAAGAGAPGDGAPVPGGEDLRYRRAAAAYLGLGLAVVAITVASPELLRPERRADLVHLAVALPFVALFAALIAWGDRWTAAIALLLARASWAPFLRRQARRR